MGLSAYIGINRVYEGQEWGNISRMVLVGGVPCGTRTLCGYRYDGRQGAATPCPVKYRARASRTLLIDNYDSYTYNLYQIIADASGVQPRVIKNDEISRGELRSMVNEGQVTDIIVSPGPGSPHEPTDVGVSAEAFLSLPDVPILGVCLGLQVLAAVHGARVCHAPAPAHGIRSAIEHDDHPLFEGIPSGLDYQVVRYHSLAVDPKTLPHELLVTAWSEPSEDTDKALHLSGFSRLPSGENLVMALAHKSLPHYGVQYHPESISSDWGVALLRNFLNISRRHRGEIELPPMERHILKGPPGRRVPERAWPFPVKEDLPAARKPGLVVSFERIHCASLTTPQGSQTLFELLNGSPTTQDTWWLDTASADRGRFSYLGGRWGPLWRRFVYSRGSDGRGRLRTTGGSSDESLEQTDLLSWLRRELSSARLDPSAAAQAAEELPFDFWGGLVGYIGYELRDEINSMSATGDRSTHPPQQLHAHVATPDAAFFFADRTIAIDHLEGVVYVLALHDTEGRIAALDWVSSTVRIIRERGERSVPAPTLYESSLAYGDTPSVDGQKGLIPRADRTRYLRDVRSCQEALHSGESYELCLTTQFERDDAPDAWELYRALRGTNPAPHAAWLAFGDDADVQVCCSSPERFLKLGRGGTLESKPIKGTRARSPDLAVDAAIISELRECAKDKSENLMIVDLLRNDLGRVSVPGSIHVTEFMDVETHATVHQLVSTVRGQLEEGKDIVDCLAAAFPGGSMTGAPKLRSMDILEEIEGGPRGVYSGSIGFFSVNGTADLNIVIRTAVISDGKLSVGAGGAITVASKPEDEYAEMRTKAAPLMRAVAVAEGRLLAATI